MTLRSLLFVPGDAPAKIARALASDAGTVIIDLEDSVAAAQKPLACAHAQAALSAPRTRPIAIRVNAQDTDWYRDDLVAIAASAPDFIVLPKCSGMDALVRADYELALLERAHGLTHGRIRLLPLVTEDAASVLALDYRSAPARTAALCFAAEDLARDLGVAPRDSQGQFVTCLAHARIATVYAARAAGLPAIDTPFPDIRNADALTYETEAARQAGYAGKLCIHPDQIATVERIFQPSQTQIDWANAVIRAFDANPDAGVVAIDGAMVDRAHLRRARELQNQPHL